MHIDGPITSQTIDSSGEILFLKGLDISDFKEGRAFANWEHDNTHPDNIIGIFKYAKKIFKADDCDNERQRLFWDQLKTPFLYGVCELFDDQDHPGAIAVAAMLRYFKKRKEKVMIGFSIEGSTLERKGNQLLETVARKCAITLKPCNRQCMVDVLDESDFKKFFEKSESTNSHLVEVDSAILDDEQPSPTQDLKKALEDFRKTLTAGMGNVAPSSLVGGSALSAEFIEGKKNRIKAAVRDWNRRRPLRETIKAALPEVSDQYIDHFVDLAEDISLKKSGKTLKLYRIGQEHSKNLHADDKQKSLVNGVYMDPYKSQPFDGEGSNLQFKLPNDAGKQVLIKYPLANAGSDGYTAHNASHYYHLARDFFGMHDHVPATTHFEFPQYMQNDTGGDDELPDNAPWSATEHVEGKSPAAMTIEEYSKHLDKARENGSAHKLALMDLISGTHDRHIGNALVDKSGKFLHIDNDEAFAYGHSRPFYLSDKSGYGMLPEGMPSVDADSLHVDAQQWLKKLSPKKLGKLLNSYGLDPQKSATAIKRLMIAQQMGAKGATIDQIHQAMIGGVKDQND